MYTTIIDNILWSFRVSQSFDVIIGNQNEKSYESNGIHPYIKKSSKIYYLFHISFGFLQFILL